MRGINEPMREKMSEMGYRTAEALSRATGVTRWQIGIMLGLKNTLFPGATGRLHSGQPVVIIAEELGCSPEELYPASHYFRGLSEKDFAEQVTRSQLAWMCHISTGDPRIALEYLEGEWAIDAQEILEMCKDAGQRDVLRRRFVESKTRPAVAKEIGTNVAKIEALEALGIKSLKAIAFRGKTPQSERLRDIYMAWQGDG